MHHLSSNCWPWDISRAGRGRANRGFLRHTQRRQALPIQAALLPRDSPNREAQLCRRHGMRAEEHKLTEAASPSASQLAQLEGRIALKAPVRALFIYVAGRGIASQRPLKIKDSQSFSLSLFSTRHTHSCEVSAAQTVQSVAQRDVRNSTLLCSNLVPLPPLSPWPHGDQQAIS